MQPNLERTYFRPQEEITSLVDSVHQTMAFTGYYNIGDIVDIIDVGPDGCRISLIGTRTIVAIEKDSSLIFDTTIDTSVATGTPYAFARNIDDGQEAIDRLYHRVNEGQTCEINEPIVDQALNQPVGGKTTYYVADVGYLHAGDTIKVIGDEGLVGSATIDSVDPKADESANKSIVVITSVLDTSTFTNPKIQLILPTCTAIERLRQDIDKIDLPVENELLDTPDCLRTAFETDYTYRAGSTQLYLDGVKLRLGTVGTRATLTQGAGNSALTFTSLILGTDGNKTKVGVVAGAGLTVSLSGDYTVGFTITVNDNGGAATSAEIAAAINADAVAKRLVQAVYGGTGAGVVAAFAATALATGANDGSGDYAEVPQVINNVIANTGYKWVALWILPSERNRLNKPPRNSEELTINYRRIMYNA
jgi:hypothetical protein